MSSQDFQRNNERICHEIAIYPGVEDLDCTVIRRRGEERVGWVEVEGTYSPRVVSEQMA